jgi:outer membrane protein TolC
MRLASILLVLLGASAAALAQTNTVQTNTVQARMLSLEDCITIAVEHNLDVQISRYNPELTLYTLDETYGAYDPTFSASAEHDYSLAPGGRDANGLIFTGQEADANVFTTGLTGLLPWGMNYSVGGNLSDTYGTQPVLGETFRVPFESARGQVGLLQLKQPLLRNLWIDSTRLAILVNKAALKMSELDLRLQVMTTINNVEQAYWTLISARDNVGVQQKALELAEQLLSENKKKVEIGALAPLDEKQAESQAASAKAALLSAIESLGTQERVLKSLLSDDYSQWKDTSIQPTEKLFAIPEKFDLQESWRRGLSLRPDLLKQKLAIAQQGYRVRFDKNQKYPELDLIGSAGWNASSQSGIGSAFDQVRGRDNPFWTAGGQISIPLGNTKARYQYKLDKGTKEQLSLTLKQMEQNTLILIENAIAVAVSGFQQVDATREARIYAAAALDAEQKKLESGKSTSFQVLQLQKDLTTARSSEISALTAYNNALSQLAFLEGTTLERRNVKLEVK